MNLKTFLRSWLGVAALETRIDELPAPQRVSHLLRQEIADAIEFVLTPPSTEPQRPHWSLFFPDDRRRIEDVVSRVTGRQAEATAKITTQHLIGTEEFIDEVVARIRKKQLDK